MNFPSPAIVSQHAVRRFPRWALLLFCSAYVIAGFIGRGPWKNADIAAFGYMRALAGGQTDWLHPLLAGMPPETDGLLAYWLGAAAIRIAPAWMSADLAARIPFALLLGATLAATWYAVYSLARSPRAQPVAFAFGGEARPRDYARAIADGGLLALVACLGLAQLSHEGTAYVTQLSFTALAFFGLAAAPDRRRTPIAAFGVGLCGLVLSGAPTLAVLFGLGGAVLAVLEARQEPGLRGPRLRWALHSGIVTLAAATLAAVMGLWHWRIVVPSVGNADLRSIGRLLLWFTWPTWPLACWTLWRWRRQWWSLEIHRHVALPVWFAGTAVLATVFTQPADRALLLGLPALAALAAFALPTLGRSVSALIDWFTLLFFTGAAIVIWVVWIAMQTGWPRQPAANVAKLAPGFVAPFSGTAFVVALMATLAWAALVRWRVGRHQAALWKSVVLPAGGAALAWLLLMTLWLPLLDYARSFAPQVAQASALIGHPTCVNVRAFTRAQVAAFAYHAQLRVLAMDEQAGCPVLLVAASHGVGPEEPVDPSVWRLVGSVARPADQQDTVQVFHRVAPATR